MITVEFRQKELNKFAKGLKAYKLNTSENVKDAINTSALNVEKGAKEKVPVRTKKGGRLRSSINIKAFNKGFTYEVGTNVIYAPYVEFGTGALVEVPQGLESYASQFKGKGVKKVNLPARPFLFNTMEEERKPHIKRLKKALKG